MPDFTRAIIPGGTFFFTVVTYKRRPIFKWSVARIALRNAIRRVQETQPFTLDAIVLLPDHIHCIWTLPPGDTEYSRRWQKIKGSFTHSYLTVGGREAQVTGGQSQKGLRGVWQQRFWEHVIRDEVDWQRHVDYIHFNPVKHGYVECPHKWPWSSFSQWVNRKVYSLDWCCQCKGKRADLPSFDSLKETALE